MRFSFSLIVLFGLQLFLPPFANGDETRPNIIMIVADDLGWADLTCYGSKFFRTPNLDKLATEGKRFTQAYAACPVCSPTRAALMTGKWPARLHLTDWLPGRPDMPDHKLARPVIRQELPLEETTIAEALKTAGYTTAHMGKWHLGGEGFGPLQQGFDLNIAGDHTGTPLSYFAPFGRGKAKMTGLEDAPTGEYLPDRLTKEAEKFIEANKAKPFFLYMPHYSVHTPLVAKPEIIAKYAKWDGTPHGRQENPIYAAMLESLDDSVGRIMKKLDETGLKEKTIVIFTSDNGGLATREGANTPATFNSPLREGKGWLYEGGVRVPLIVRWPASIKPGLEQTPVWSADLFCTLRDFAGVKDKPVVDGVSLAGLLKDGRSLEPRSLYWHYPHYANQGSRPSASIRDGNWKMIEVYQTGRRELFDLSKDMSESHNLAEQEPKKVAELAAKLAKWRAEIKVQMPTPNPDYSPSAPGKNGVITLPARMADVHGVMLRYEPLPHKQTIGYWVRKDDWASWEFDVTKPGKFDVEGLVGCGNGSGGSVVTFTVDGQTLQLTVPVTGGFQNFKPQKLGQIAFAQSGRYTLKLRAISKPGGAVMDLREIKFTPITN
jgi:arylsulfatase A-like enzyme